ncbi:MAG: transcriptional repressor LexA [Fimbriiglobus sp.]
MPKRTKNLTPKQQEIFDFIKAYITDNGYPPAIRDIGKAFDIRSPNGVMCHLRALQKKGFIHRDEKNDTQGGKARAITIPGLSIGGFSLPLLGLVAAGPTLEATENRERIDMKQLFGGENIYLLKVRGESMIESQIADGDFVVIRKQDSADNGEKVVAMVDKAMTLKKFFKKKDQIRLEPCNSNMAPIIVDPALQNVQVLGLLVGVIRKYG